MPKLLIFAPCQKAIVDRTDSLMSLIGVFHGFVLNDIIKGDAPTDEPLPADAKIPMQWAIGTEWLRLLDEEDKTFEQHIEIVSPDGTRMEVNIQPFKMTHRTHQVVVLAGTFPIGVPGKQNLVLSLRESGTNDEWQKIAEYPIEITHKKNNKKTDE
jgi:hypothetical protein